MKSDFTLGLLIGNRGFFPAHLCRSGREALLNGLNSMGIQVVALTDQDTRYGSVESLEDAEKCAALFKDHRDELDGVLVSLPNFGDERSIANTLRWADLDVPVLIHAFPDDLSAMDVELRRDSFCGKISVCNNLNQYGIPFSLTRQHTTAPEAQEFREDLSWFQGVCRVVSRLSNVRLGQIGARPAAFNTVRYSEKILERNGISVETIDLSELLGRAKAIDSSDQALRETCERIRAYADTSLVPEEALLRIARFSLVVDRWMEEKRLSGTAVQCWTAMQDYFGVVPCVVMSMLSDRMMPSACETDILGTISMMALSSAAGMPSAIVDWNNNYGDDLTRAVLFHCSNLPKSMLCCKKGRPSVGYHQILAASVGRENAYGNLEGRLAPGPVSFCRVSTDETQGTIRGYTGEGMLTEDPLDTFGGFGVIEIPYLQELLKMICREGFEHHVAIAGGNVAAIVEEALGVYLDWEIKRL